MKSFEDQRMVQATALLSLRVCGLPSLKIHELEIKSFFFINYLACSIQL